MSRLLTETFELGVMYRFSSYNTTITTANPLDGARALNIGANQYADISLPSSYSELYIGFFSAFNPTSTPMAVVRWQNGANELGRLQMDYVTGKLQIYVNNVLVATGSSTINFTITSDPKYHIQVHIKIALAGNIDVKLNDISEVSYAGDTRAGFTNIDKFRFGLGHNGVFILDDIVINDTSGVLDNSWPGILKYQTMLTTGNGFYSGNWQKNSGSAADYTYVDENPNDGDTTYLYTTSLNTYASFSMADQAISNATYMALLTEAIAKKDSGSVKLTVGIRDNENSTNYFGVTSDLGVSYGIVEERRTVDPSTGVAWTSGGINATEALIVSSS